MSNKVIEFNPSLLNVKKKKEKKHSMKPLISPNILKNKLLKRIKEHKLREENKEDKKKDLEINIDNTIDLVSYSNEFNDSIQYLQNLTQINEQKKKKAELERKTLKNNYSPYYTLPIVNVDLPEELQIENIPSHQPSHQPSHPPIHSPIHPSIHSPINPPIHPQINNDVPYGILKGGSKPTFRTWNKTQKNSNVNVFNERTNKLNLLKNKIREQNSMNPIPMNPIPMNPIPMNSIPMNPIPMNPIQKRSLKKIIKKTIHRKFTLGKSKTKKIVSVLLKDNKTQKNIINAQKELKRQNMNDVKYYLKNHNLIKIGSNAPNDVIRKIYESSILAGEITNNNSDILLHNFQNTEE